MGDGGREGDNLMSVGFSFRLIKMFWNCKAVGPESRTGSGDRDVYFFSSKHFCKIIPLAHSYNQKIFPF